MSKESKPVLVFCKACDKKVLPVPKVFGVKLCPLCNVILQSGIPSEKASI